MAAFSAAIHFIRFEKMITTVTLNPALDKTIYVKKLLPNDTNRIEKIEIDAGGKGINTARVLKELEVEAVTTGFLGGKTGRYIRQVLEEEGVSCDFVTVATETRTNLAIQDADGSPPTTLNDRGAPVTPENLEKLKEKTLRYAAKSQFLLLAGSLPPQVPVDIYKTFCESISELPVRVVVDADGAPLAEALKARPFMAKPNTDEIKRLFGIEITDEDSAVFAVKKLAEQVELAVISMGKRGAIASRGGEIWRALAPQVKPASTIGSGDSMIAGMLSQLTLGKDLDEALVWGCAAGAATAMTNGAEIGRKKDILNLLGEVIVKRM